MYGMNVVRWTETDLAKLEVIQNTVGRMALGASKWTAVEAIRGDLGWSTFSERLMKAVLLYKVRIERMNDSRLVRKVFEWNLGNSNWEKECFRKAKVLMLQKLPCHLAGRQGNGWVISDESGEGHVWQTKEWKKFIDKRVKSYGRFKWAESMRQKSTLNWYTRKISPSYELFYDGGFASELLFRVRTKSLAVNDRTYRWNENKSRICSQCNAQVDETVEHFMLDCSKYEAIRVKLMDAVIEKYGRSEWLDRVLGEDRGMCVLVGLEKIVNIQIVQGTKEFLNVAWSMRAE